MCLKNRKKYITLRLILGLGFLVYFFLYTTEDKRYAEVTTPDGQYTIYSCKYKYCRYSRYFPFHESDYDSGKAYLYDEVEKKVIGSGHVDMVSMDHLAWSEEDIYFKGEGPWWKLPRKMMRLE